MLVTAPQPLWPDIARNLGDGWDAVAVPMVAVRPKDDRKYHRFAQQLLEGHFSVAVFVNLLSARYALQGPSPVVRAAVSGIRDVPVIAQSPEVALELSGLGIDAVVPERSDLYDFMDVQEKNLRGKNLLLFSGESFNPLISAGMKRLGAKVEQLTTYTSKALEGSEQKEAVNAIINGDFFAITFESESSVDALFGLTTTPRERRLLVRSMNDLVVKAQNPVVADALARRRVDARVPREYDFAHLFA